MTALRQISLKASGATRGTTTHSATMARLHNVRRARREALFALIYHPEIKGCQTTTESIVVSATRRIDGSLRSCTLCPVIIRRQKRREIVHHAVSIYSLPLNNENMYLEIPPYRLPLSRSGAFSAISRARSFKIATRRKTHQRVNKVIEFEGLVLRKTSLGDNSIFTSDEHDEMLFSSLLFIREDKWKIVTLPIAATPTRNNRETIYFEFT